MRGQSSSPGDTRVAPNGYHYTRTHEGWKLTHQLVMEKQLGRKLEKGERVRFRDNDRTNIKADNLYIQIVRVNSIDSKIASIDEKIIALQHEKEILLAQKEAASNGK